MIILKWWKGITGPAYCIRWGAFRKQRRIVRKCVIVKPRQCKTDKLAQLSVRAGMALGAIVLSANREES
jgi:hypothetical protein